MSFQDPYIDELEFNINKDFEGHFEGFTDIGLSLNSQKVESSDKDGTYKTSLTIKVGERTNVFPFYCKVIMSGIFYLNTDADIREEDFANYHTAAILYSYARPIISDLTSKSGFPPFNLPFMNFIEADLNYNKND